MKKILFTLSVIFTILSASAQNDLERSIMSYTDSTKQLIENGRQMLVRHIIDHKFADANTVLNFLKKKAGDEYVVLYPTEEILTSLAIRNFQLFLYNAKNFSDLLKDKRKFPNYQGITQDLHSNIQKEMVSIRQDLEMAGLSEKDKELIEIYLAYYNNADVIILKNKIRNFTKLYPNNEYQDFLKQIKVNTNLGRFNFGFAYLNETFSGNITNTIETDISGMLMEMDFVVNKTYVSLYLGGSINTLYTKKDLPILHTDWTYLQGNEIATLRYGLKVGYIAAMNKWMKTYPYINIGGLSVTAQADDIDIDEKNELMGSFMPGFGLASEINLFSWSTNSMYGPRSFVYLKPNIEYNFLTTQKEHFKGQAFSFSVTVGMGFGNF